jgi:hypothetical protein
MVKRHFRLWEQEKMAAEPMMALGDAVLLLILIGLGFSSEELGHLLLMDFACWGRLL